jgi:adenosylcobinamide-GDP ribazoletransferase
VAVLLSMGATIRLTGAFHEDALADSLDGFGGGWTREQVLHIMKDSRVGSYALVGMCVALMLKAALITELATVTTLPATGFTGRWPVVVPAMLAAHVLARGSSVALIGALPYVRSHDELARVSAGRPFVAGVTRFRVILAVLSAVVLSVVLLGGAAWTVLLAAAAATALAARYFRARIGGITGDALGAANQVVELVVYLALSASVQEASFLRIGRS